MGIISGKCHKCGHDITVDESIGEGVCGYCGSEFAIDAAEKKISTTLIVTKDTENILKNIFMKIEDGQIDQAKKKLDGVFDENPESGEAFLAKLMIELGLSKKEDLQHLRNSISENMSYKRAVRFADEKLKKELTGYAEHIDERNSTIKAIERRIEKNISDYNEMMEFMIDTRNSFIENIQGKSPKELLEELRKLDLRTFVEGVSSSVEWFDKCFEMLKIYDEYEETMLATLELDKELEALKKDIIDF